MATRAWARVVAPALLLLFAVPGLPGIHPSVSTPPEPYFELLLYSPYLACSIDVLAPGCNTQAEAWSAPLLADEGLTALVVAARWEGPRLDPLGAGWVAFELLTPDGARLASWEAPPPFAVRRFEFSHDAPAPPGEWSLRARPWPGSPLPTGAGGHALLFAEDLRVAVTFAYWGYELPDDWTGLPEDGQGAAPVRILYLPAELGDLLPCASTSSIRGSPRLPLSTTNCQG